MPVVGGEVGGEGRRREGERGGGDGNCLFNGDTDRRGGLGRALARMGTGSGMGCEWGWRRGNRRQG